MVKSREYYIEKINDLQDKKKHVEDYYKKGLNTIISFYKEKLEELENNKQK